MSVYSTNLDLKFAELKKAVFRHAEERYNFAAEAMAAAVASILPQYRERFDVYDLPAIDSVEGSMSSLGQAKIALERNSSNERATALEEVRLLCNDWEGKSAGAFKRYTRSLENAFEDQYTFMAAMNETAKVQRALVEATHESCLDLIQQVIDHLGADAQQISQERRRFLGQIVSAATGFLGGLLGGPVSAAAGAISAVGAIAGAIVASPKGEHTMQIVAGLKTGLAGVEKALAKDQGKVAEALRALRDPYIDGPERESIVPAKMSL